MELQIILIGSLAFLITALQLADARAEYYSPVFIQDRGMEDYHVHHDEKQIVPDARFFFFRKKRAVAITDFVSYPLSGAFGIAGPGLAYLGFRTAGFNNLGLRLFFILMTSITGIFCIISLLTLAPGTIGTAASIIYLLNYNNFVINRLAIIEHILTFLITGIIMLYVTQPVLFVTNIHWIGFAAAVSVLAKPNFVIYTYLPIIVIAALERTGVSAAGKLMLYSLSGLCVCEGIQMCVLARLGIARGRYATILRGIMQVSGTGPWVALSGYCPPVGIRVFEKFLKNFLEWHGSGKAIKNPVVSFLIFLFFALLLFAGILMVRHQRSNPFYFLAVFLFLYLLSLVPFYYYLKRAFSVFPPALILFALTVHIISNELQQYCPDVVLFGRVLSGLFVLTYLAFQIKTVRELPCLRSKGVEQNSALLDQALPKDSVIYTHCLGFRFFWQVKEHRLMSCDDTLMSNPMIIDWAIKNHAHYVMLTGRKGEHYAGAVLPDTRQLLSIASQYNTLPNESDIAETFYLCKIRI